MDTQVTIKNVSLQTLELYLKGSRSPKAVYLGPGQITRCWDSQVSDQIKTLENRRLVKIS